MVEVGGAFSLFLSHRKCHKLTSLDPGGYSRLYLFIFLFSFSHLRLSSLVSSDTHTFPTLSFYCRGCVGLRRRVDGGWWRGAEPTVWRAGSHLEEVGGLCDQRRVQFRFGPDVVGVLEEVVTLWGEEP